MRLSRRALIAASVVALPLAGCGGPEIDLGAGRGLADATGGYQGAAADICTEVAAEFTSIQREEARTFAQGEEVVAALIEVARDGEEQLGSLQPPDDRVDAFGRYLDARSEVIAQLESAREAAANEDGAAYERARRAAVEAAPERAKLARGAGLAACARVEEG